MSRDLNDARYRNYVLAVLVAISFFNYMDRSVLSVLVEPIKNELHISDTQLGLLAGFTFAVFYATFGIPLARLADRSSRVRLLSLAVAAWSLMTSLSGLAQNYWHLVLTRIGVGVGEAGCVPSSHSLISDYFPPEKRAFAISVFQAGGVAGVTVGLALTGLVADLVGWRWAFVIIGAPGLLVALLAWLTVREPERGRYERPGPKKASLSAFGDIRALWGRKTYRQLLLAVAVGNFAANGLGQWTPAFFVRVHGLSLAEMGFWLGAASGIGGVLGMVSGGALSIRLVSRDRRWEVWFPALTIGLAMPLYLVTFLTPVTSVALIAKFLSAFIAALGYGVGLSAVQSVTPPNMRAMAIALVMFAAALIGMGMGPLAVGFLSDLLTPEFGRFSLRYALLICLISMAWGIAHFLLAARTFRQDAASLREEAELGAQGADQGGGHRETAG